MKRNALYLGLILIASNFLTTVSDKEIKQFLKMSESKQNEHLLLLSESERQELLNKVKGAMVTNIENILDRGKKVEMVVESVDDLSCNALEFKKAAKNLKKQQCCCCLIQ